ncbi:fertilization-influencing membrane protein [Tachyglossus aculeatus]|uniref:fertilization-influencing membrane protein n=1 Tax=Tachyglossus aculeatus TaxID=9261 RepID=UPI0018F5FE7F|nr:fertilization-influencing membrane protein [Tachyglossus aculeatus]
MWLGLWLAVLGFAAAAPVRDRPPIEDEPPKSLSPPITVPAGQKPPFSGHDPQRSVDQALDQQIMFLGEPNWFDYADTDQAKILVVYHLIGEKPVFFSSKTYSSKFLGQVLFGSFILLLLLIIFQLCYHMYCKKGPRGAGRPVP